jgi:hypothetical protein
MQLFVQLKNKEMKPLLFIAALFLFFAGSAQKTINDPNVAMRTLTGSFHSIEVSNGIDVFLSEGEEALAVSAKDPDARDRIKAEIRDGVLVLSYEWKEGINVKMYNNKGLVAYVSYKQLKRITASSGSDIKIDGTLKGEGLELDLSSGSDFKGKVDLEKLVVDITGGSDVDLTGKAIVLVVEARSGSDFDGYDLETDYSVIEASAGSDVSVTVHKELTAEATGGSDINWKGSAEVKKSKASGAGSVSHRS